jgi:hypothetical protein
LGPSNFLRLRTIGIAPGSKIKLVIDPSAQNPATIQELRLKNVRLPDALRIIAIQTGCRLTADGTTLRLVKP